MCLGLGMATDVMRNLVIKPIPHQARQITSANSAVAIPTDFKSCHDLTFPKYNVGASVILEPDFEPPLAMH